MRGVDAGVEQGDDRAARGRQVAEHVGPADALERPLVGEARVAGHGLRVADAVEVDAQDARRGPQVGDGRRAIGDGDGVHAQGRDGVDDRDAGRRQRVRAEGCVGPGLEGDDVLRGRDRGGSGLLGRRRRRLRGRGIGRARWARSSARCRASARRSAQGWDRVPLTGWARPTVRRTAPGSAGQTPAVRSDRRDRSPGPGSGRTATPRAGTPGRRRARATPGVGPSNGDRARSPPSRTTAGRTPPYHDEITPCRAWATARSDRGTCAETGRKRER